MCLNCSEIFVVVAIPFQFPFGGQNYSFQKIKLTFLAITSGKPMYDVFLYIIKKEKKIQQ